VWNPTWILILKHRIACLNSNNMNFRRKRIFSLLTAIYESGLFSGVIIGWGSWAYVLKHEGLYLRLTLKLQPEHGGFGLNTG